MFILLFPVYSIVLSIKFVLLIFSRFSDTGIYTFTVSWAGVEVGGSKAYPCTSVTVNYYPSMPRSFILVFSIMTLN